MLVTTDNDEDADKVQVMLAYVVFVCARSRMSVSCAVFIHGPGGFVGRVGWGWLVVG
jgi:hypothetical protein